VDAVSNPKDPSYRHFLTPEEVGARFGPSPSAVEAVAGYLQSKGLQVDRVGKAHLTILASGSVANCADAFHTTINHYCELATIGAQAREFICYSSPLSVPAKLANSIQSVDGLETFTRPHPAILSPSQALAIYGAMPMFQGGSQGQGRTVGISSWDGFRLDNVPPCYAYFNLPAPASGVLSNVTVVPIQGGSGSGPQYGEGDLDIQMVLEMAPLCNLRIYDGWGGVNETDTYDGPSLIDTLTVEEDENLADIITESYAWNIEPSTDQAAHNLHLAMSAQGITYVAASGDWGTDLNDWPYPGYDGEVLMVGGTVAQADSNGNRLSEVGCPGSGGGWSTNPSSLNVQPAYQVGNGVPTGIGHRLEPDIAINMAGPNGAYYVYLGGWSFGWWGTSFASPVLAGLLADTEQAIVQGGGLPPDSLGNQRFGRLQDLVYSQNGRSDIWLDITSGNNGNLPNGLPSNCGLAWDTVTGWGAPNMGAFAQTQIPALTSFKVDPSAIVGGTGTTGTLTISMPAGTNATVEISGGDSNVGYSRSFAFEAGLKSATFAIATSPVSACDTEVLTASMGSVTLSATFELNPSSGWTFRIAGAQKVGGYATTGTITLSKVAGPSGAEFSISGGDSAVGISPTVVVPAGSRTATFPITTMPVATADVELISASPSSGSTHVAVITVLPPVVESLQFNSSGVGGGSPATGLVRLHGLAGPGGARVSLSGGDSAVTYPLSVYVPAGQSRASFTVETAIVPSPFTEALTASFMGSQTTGTLQIGLPYLAEFNLAAKAKVGGYSTTGTLTLNGVVGASPLSVTLSGGDGFVSYPVSVTVPSGASSAVISIATSPVPASDPETINATLGSVSLSQVLTVLPPIVQSVVLDRSSVIGGGPVMATVSLHGRAGPGGVLVAVTGGDAAVAYPSTVLIPAGAYQAKFKITTSAVTSETLESISATADSISASANLTITP
jgi:hypothetical protein